MIAPLVPRSQSLRFVNMVGYATNPYTHDSKLLQDDGKSFDDIMIYCRKFDITDKINVQFFSDYVAGANVVVKLELFNYLGVSAGVITTTPTLITSGWYVYNALIDTTSLLGYYYCVLTLSGAGKPSYLFQTDYFQVGNFSDYPKLQWRESDYDGLYYLDATLKFGLRIESDITRFNIATESESFELYNSTIVNARTKTKRVTNFNCDPLPAFVCEALDLAFAHKKVYINGIEYVASSEATCENIKGSLYYTYSRDLAEANYEVYDQTVLSGGDSGGGEPPTPSGNGYSPDGIDTYSSNGTDTYTPY